MMKQWKKHEKDYCDEYNDELIKMLQYFIVFLLSESFAKESKKKFHWWSHDTGVKIVKQQTLKIHGKRKEVCCIINIQFFPP